jgi:hypothetical protein
MIANARRRHRETGIGHDIYNGCYCLYNKIAYRCSCELSCDRGLPLLWFLFMLCAHSTMGEIKSGNLVCHITVVASTEKSDEVS